MVYRNLKRRGIDPIQPKCSKKIYYSEAEAKDVIEHLKSTRHVREIRAYKCMMCGFWHLTSRT